MLTFAGTLVSLDLIPFLHQLPGNSAERVRVGRQVCLAHQYSPTPTMMPGSLLAVGKCWLDAMLMILREARALGL